MTDAIADTRATRDALRQEYDAMPLLPVRAIPHGSIIANLDALLYRVVAADARGISYVSITIDGTPQGPTQFLSVKHSAVFRIISDDYLTRYRLHRQDYAAVVMRTLDRALAKVAAIQSHTKRVSMRDDINRSLATLHADIQEIDAKYAGEDDTDTRP